MGTLLLLTSALQASAEVLPGLALLSHQVKILPAEGSALLEAPDDDLVLVDGRQDLAHARDLCRLIRTTGSDVPVLLIVTEGGLSVVDRRLGHGRRGAAHLRTGRARGPDQAGHRPPGRPARGRRPRVARDPHRRGRRRRRDVHREAQRPSARPDLQGVRAPQVPRPAPGAGVQPRSSCCRRSGATTTSAAPAPSTCTYAACGPSSAPRTRPSSAPSATSATASCCPPRSRERQDAPAERDRGRLTLVSAVRHHGRVTADEIPAADWPARGAARSRPSARPPSTRTGTTPSTSRRRCCSRTTASRVAAVGHRGRLRAAARRRPGSGGGAGGPRPRRGYGARGGVGGRRAQRLVPRRPPGGQGAGRAARVHARPGSCG